MRLEKINPVIVVAKYMMRWTIIVAPVSVVIGLVVAAFLWLLEAVTEFRWLHPWMLLGLPAAGFLIWWLYKVSGKNAVKGNNLVIDEIHEPGAGVPGRMAPLIFFTTILTHAVGGSAGREGTAVQIGSSLADVYARILRLTVNDKRILLVTGISAGFAAVFGTPVAGTIFAIEVLTIGRIRYNALFPAFISAMIAHFTCVGVGIHHTTYRILFSGHLESIIGEEGLLLFGKVFVAGVLFGIVGALFVWLTRSIRKVADDLLKKDWLVPVAGGCVLLMLSMVPGSGDFLGLGVHSFHGRVSITQAFTSYDIGAWSWLWKLIFTAITLGFGFKGGEVTPLFFIGAALGNTIAVTTGAPIDLFAALGFIAVFAAATNTPLACTVMGVELFGGEHLLFFAFACFVAYYCSGHSGIYHAQRLEEDKTSSV